MSEAKEQINTGLGLGFFESLSGFFEKSPRTGIWFLHIMVDELSETIGRTEGLDYDTYYFLGRIRVLEELLWENDGYKAILNTVANPEVLPKLLEAISLLARVHNMIKDNSNVDVHEVNRLMDEISSTLYGILKTFIDKAEEKTEKTCENES